MTPLTTSKTPDTTPRHAGGTLNVEDRAILECRALVTYLRSIMRAGTTPSRTVQAHGASTTGTHPRTVSSQYASKTRTDPRTGQTYRLHFVAIYHGDTMLAVYRIRPVKVGFMLRRLKRWPRGLVAGLNPSN